MTGKVAAIAIGKNEGARFLRCLAALQGKADPIIYVDSGSTDGSVDAARDAGAHVVALQVDASAPFTAARARNAGLAKLAELQPEGAFVQFLDGDCELQEGWIETGLAAMEADPGLAVVCGRRRERFPEASIWNAMIDSEWDTPIGPAKASGGDALIRRAALEDVGGYDASLIAGEEPEMCYRMRHHEKAWRIERLDAEMTLHDAAMTKVSQWWQRARRAGHAFAEGAAMYGKGPEKYRLSEVRRALVWGALLPALVLVALAVFGPWGGLLALAWPAQILRLRARGYPWSEAVFLTLGKFPEAQGVLGYWLGRVTGRKRGLIEYK